mmetsp:Transcript_6726/g.15844  ORF Transcript_6726/g.15844 Transcript_6726/m.15844 type:complete len:202 (+) Transcript_6726:352-957(+)
MAAPPGAWPRHACKALSVDPPPSLVHAYRLPELADVMLVVRPRGGFCLADLVADDVLRGFAGLDGSVAAICDVPPGEELIPIAKDALTEGHVTLFWGVPEGVPVSNGRHEVPVVEGQVPHQGHSALRHAGHRAPVHRGSEAFPGRHGQASESTGEPGVRIQCKDSILRRLVLVVEHPNLLHRLRPVGFVEILVEKRSKIFA